MAEDGRYVRKAVITVAIVFVAVGFGLLLTHLTYVLLLLFAALLFSVFIDGAATPLEKCLHLPHKAAVPVVTLLFLGSLGIVAYLIGPAVADQASQLMDRLPQSAERLRSHLDQYGWGRWLVEHTRSQWTNAGPSMGRLASGLTGAFSTLFGAVSDVVIIIVMGFYLALQPRLYRAGLLNLFPSRRRARLSEVLATANHALRWWLIGRGLSMLVVGVLTGTGLWIIGLPLALALAVLAGILSFIPFLGPIAAAIPAVLVGLIEGTGMAANVMLVYAAVQFLESNIITPVIQVRAVSLPPAVMLSGQLVMGVLFGLMGLLLATPLMVSIMVLVQTLYVNDVLKTYVKPLGQ